MPDRIVLRACGNKHRKGLDPNVWFGNLELMVAQDIGQVTVTYLGNVYKYYVAYQRALEDHANQQSAEQQTKR